MLVVQAPTSADACHVAGDGACTLDQRHGGLGPGRSGTSNRADAVGNGAVMAMAITYNWLFLWDYTFYKWGFVSTYNLELPLASLLAGF